MTKALEPKLRKRSPLAVVIRVNRETGCTELKGVREEPSGGYSTGSCWESLMAEAADKGFCLLH